METLLDPRPVAPVNPESSGNGFEATSWSLVLAAARDEGSGPALNRLCRKYWRPIYIYARRVGLGAPEAEDLTQDFFVYLLERNWLKEASPDRGSFRAYLLTLFKNFLANYRRRRGAGKRSGAQPDISFDAAACDAELRMLASTELDAVKVYERVWANCVLQAAMNRLSDEQANAGKLAVFEMLRPFIRQPPLPGDYEALGRRLNLTRGRIALQIHRLSRRFAELIRLELAETLVDRSVVESELRHLLEAISP